MTKINDYAIIKVFYSENMCVDLHTKGRTVFIIATKNKKITERKLTIMTKKILAAIILMVFTLCMFTGCGFTPADEKDSTEVESVAKEPGYVWGIDISRYQEGLTDEFFVKLKNAGCKFIYIQFGLTNYPATIEAPINDFSEIAYTFAEQAEKNEIHFGFYFLSEATTEAYRRAETSFILEFLKDVEGKNYKYNKLPLMLDHEVNEETQDVTNAKIQQLAAQVDSMNKMGYETIIYTSEVRYNALNSIFGNEQNFWLANWSIVDGTGIAPEENSELIPDSIKNSANVKIWQYATDNAILGERFREITLEDLNQNMAIDRNIMKEEYFETLISGKSVETEQNAEVEDDVESELDSDSDS